ncbi:TraI domain-containing protein [Paraburkholderia acidisoli]|uniref:Type VI secretion protein n=1 Tax=Paraburkholderia acidisoli TaxID=2571748 RepID=A0A7Z2GSH5_9BURK|nr:TraI domain-containing protein [Paraburkholderia acidisoli]QGZ67020.1 type VI secretion protein [Paraburkholderia acidisoli]
MTAPGQYEALDAEALLDQHNRRVALIRQAANEARDEDYCTRWRDVLVRCAAWFSSLPYSPTLYREPAGAFRCTVETAFYAMRLAGGQKFGTSLPSEKRRVIEPQYNHAVFLAAVCSGLDEPYRHFIVTRKSDRAQWNPAGHGALGPWLAGSTYALHRRDTPLPVERMRTALFAQNLIEQSLLAGYEASVLSELFGAINPVDRPQGNESLVHKVVRQAVGVAADFDRKAQQGVFEPVHYAVPTAVQVAAAVQPAPATAASPSAAPATEPANVQPPPAATVSAAVLQTAAPDAPVPGQAMPSTSPAAAAEGEGAAAVKLSTGPADTEPANGGVDATASASEPGRGASKHDPQLGLPFAGDITPPPPVDPSAMRVPTSRVETAAPPAAFDEVLQGMPNMIRDFFRALREDVATGKSKVEWTDKGLAISKRLVGSFGVASDTLVEHLRRRGLVVSNVQTEIVLAVRAGELILERADA